MEVEGSGWVLGSICVTGWCDPHETTANFPLSIVIRCNINISGSVWVLSKGSLRFFLGFDRLV